MARLRIAADLLIAQLFDGKAAVQVLGATFDAQRGAVMLDIAGPSVPKAEEVIAIVRVNRDAKVEEVTFKQV